MIRDNQSRRCVPVSNVETQDWLGFNLTGNDASLRPRNAIELPTGTLGSSNKNGDSDEAASMQSGVATKIAPFTPLNCMPFETEYWQSYGLLKKKGVFLIIVPPGACSSTLCAYFAELLSGRVLFPFGRAWYPGDVLLSTHTSNVQRVINSSFSSGHPSDGQIFTQVTPRRFNWRAPMVNLKGALADRKEGKVSAVIVDTGVFAQGIDEAIVESAYASLNDMADEADCLILLVVESTSRSVDPFERVPRSLRILRGTLLVVPLVSKVLRTQPGAAAEFLLLRLEETAASALTVRFRLEARGFSGTACISWDRLNFSDPRAAFISAETVDLTTAQRAAVQLASEVIGMRGPMTSADLKSFGCLNGIAPTTMRDALSVAKLLGQLVSFRRNDGRCFWSMPGMPQYVGS